MFDYFDLELKLLSQDEKNISSFSLYHLIKNDLKLEKKNNDYSNILLNNYYINELLNNKVLSYDSSNNIFSIQSTNNVFFDVLTRYYFSIDGFIKDVNNNIKKLHNLELTKSKLKKYYENSNVEEFININNKLYKINSKINNLKEKLKNHLFKKAIFFTRNYLSKETSVEERKELLHIAKNNFIINYLIKFGVVEVNNNNNYSLVYNFSKKDSFYLNIIKNIKRNMKNL